MQEEIFSGSDLRFIHPMSCVISGPSGSGKSHICFNLIRYRDQVFDSSNVRLKILYCLPARHKIDIPEDVRNDPDVTFSSGIPDFETIGMPSLVILDDLAGEIDDTVVEAFTRFSHHKSLSIVLITHNIFHTGKSNHFRTISLNTNVFFLTRNARDRRQIGILASQISPTNTKSIVNIYQDATSRKYGYLCIDCSQTVDERLRFKTNVFPNEIPQNIIYLVS